jgi:endonuclease/exonuclease/phosphatase family metal-dependent hydrolase
MILIAQDFGSDVLITKESRAKSFAQYLNLPDSLLENLSLAELAELLDRPKETSFMTYNIRYNEQRDGVNWWMNRREHLVSLMRFYRPDVVGMQEVLWDQLSYVDSVMVDYDWIGVGRGDGRQAGEFAPIIYNTGSVELIEGTVATKWLSETPDEVSMSWDAAFPRIVTYAQFRRKVDGREFWVFNTHFDHIGQVAREHSAALIVKWIAEVAGDDGFVLLGDFNVTEENAVYEILAGADSNIIDAQKQSEIPHVGPEFTFEGFKVGGGDRRRIDYIFVRNGLEVTAHAHLSHFRGENYPSDHLPVIVRVRF